MVGRLGRLVLLVALVLPATAVADLEADFARCRTEIRRIGDNPQTPFEAYCLGLAYNFALERKRDQTKSVAWLRRAAALSYAPAETVLGYMLEQGNGTAKNPAEAFQWYQRAAAQDHDDGLFNLGRAYENGIGTTRDLALARQNYERAAKLGSKQAKQALIGLGSAPEPLSTAQQRFQDGAKLYKAKSFTEAARIFQELAQQGYAPAQLQIGYQHEFAEGVPRNEQLAAGWYRKAAEQDNPIAQNNLGKLYEAGRGVAEDWLQAAAWFQRSADQGNVRGQFSLGRAYQFGIGVPQSRQQAIAWFDRAAAQGDDQANYWVSNLRSAGNFIGFRDDDEQRLVIGAKLRTDTSLVYAEPRGVTFRNSSERFAYLQKLRQTTDQNEAEAAWNRASDAYSSCKRAGGSNCTDPGPRP